MSGRALLEISILAPVSEHSTKPHLGQSGHTGKPYQTIGSAGVPHHDPCPIVLTIPVSQATLGVKTDTGFILD